MNYNKKERSLFKCSKRNNDNYIYNIMINYLITKIIKRSLGILCITN